MSGAMRQWLPRKHRVYKSALGWRFVCGRCGARRIRFTWEKVWRSARAHMDVIHGHR